MASFARASSAEHSGVARAARLRASPTIAFNGSSSDNCDCSLLSQCSSERPSPADPSADAEQRRRRKAAASSTKAPPASRRRKPTQHSRGATPAAVLPSPAFSLPPAAPVAGVAAVVAVPMPSAPSQTSACAACIAMQSTWTAWCVSASEPERPRISSGIARRRTSKRRDEKSSEASEGVTAMPPAHTSKGGSTGSCVLAGAGTAAAEPGVAEAGRGRDGVLSTFGCWRNA
eukprot:6201539-Pleurochrysis_carterae.AAC.2